MIGILSAQGRCERASIDEVYLDLTDAAESMLLETPPELLEEIDEEVLNSHVLGVTGVSYNASNKSFFPAITGDKHIYHDFLLMPYRKFSRNS